MSVLPPLPERIARVASAEFPPQPQDSPSIGWAILGAGGIARKFTKDVKLAGSVVVAVGSRTADKAEAFAAENDVPFYGTYKDVLSRDDVDAVYVATTHNFHLEAVLEAIAAGNRCLSRSQSCATAPNSGVCVLQPRKQTCWSWRRCGHDSCHITP